MHKIFSFIATAVWALKILFRLLVQTIAIALLVMLLITGMVFVSLIFYRFTYPL